MELLLGNEWEEDLMGPTDARLATEIKRNEISCQLTWAWASAKEPCGSIDPLAPMISEGNTSTDWSYAAVAAVDMVRLKSLDWRPESRAAWLIPRGSKPLLRLVRPRRADMVAFHLLLAPMLERAEVRAGDDLERPRMALREVKDAIVQKNTIADGSSGRIG